MKLKIFFTVIFAIIVNNFYGQNNGSVGINTSSPHPTAVLDITSNPTGTENYKGVLIPRMTTTNRSTITNPAIGLAIYNTSTNCTEYWNGARWVSLCEGTSSLTISPAACSNVSADGTGCNNEFTVMDPDCAGGPFIFTIVGGSDYASFFEKDETIGTFRLTFLANNSINSRSVVVRVTSSCTGLYKDFLFTQQGQSCDPGLGTAPSISSTPGGKNISYCSGGAAYLSVPLNTPNIDQLIWTRNGIEIARGTNNITVNQAGVYDVFMGNIGCNQQAGNAVTVTRSGTNAPSPVSIVVLGNNGMVCNTMGTTKLIALKPSTGTVRWFKDNILQPLTPIDNEVNAGVGKWFAVVNDGSCWSTPSTSVDVSVDPNSGSSLIQPVVVKSGSFCAGSAVLLRVNDTSYQSNYTYTWYENNTFLGTGREYLYQVPSGTSNVVIRCRATLSGSCAVEAMSSETISSGIIPSQPVITGDKQLCSGIATLNIVPVGTGTFTYAWYKNGNLYATTQSITVTEGGNYSATVTDGCTSPAVSVNISDVTSAAPTVTLNKSADLPNIGDIVTYSAAINFTPATNYIWTVTNGTLQSGGGNNSFAVVKFNNTGPASVKVEVSNACGTGMAIHEISNVSTACIDPLSVSPSGATTVNTVTGQQATLGPVNVNFTSGGATASYQWYSNSTASNSGGIPISGATNNSFIVSNNTAGNYYYYCEVKNSGCQSAVLKTGVYTLKVNANPANLPDPSAQYAGSFIGRTCFDVALTEGLATDCGTLASRVGTQADFTNASTYTQKYIFTPKSGASVSNVRFEIVDPSGVVQSFSGGNLGTNISIPVELTVNYQQNLNERAKGLSRADALKADIYVIFNSSSNGTGTDVKIKLTVNVQDCICCPGYLAIGGADNGRNLCFFKTDASTMPNFGTGVYSCKNALPGYIDPEYASLGNWRLPSQAELYKIQPLFTTLSLQPNSSSDTTNMLSGMPYMTSQAAPPSHYIYVSSTSSGALLQTSVSKVRCVREF